MSQLNDCKLAYYQANGATSNDIQDAERKFLLAQGMTDACNADMWVEFLGPGHITDLLYAFWVANGCKFEMAAVPDVVGLTQVDAGLAITGANFVLGSVTGTVNPVISQIPAAGTIAETGSSVNITMTS